jgi:hypothetical protein
VAPGHVRYNPLVPAPSYLMARSFGGRMYFCLCHIRCVGYDNNFPFWPCTTGYHIAMNMYGINGFASDHEPFDNAPNIPHLLPNGPHQGGYNVHPILVPLRPDCRWPTC